MDLEWAKFNDFVSKKYLQVASCNHWFLFSEKNLNTFLVRQVFKSFKFSKFQIEILACRNALTWSVFYGPETRITHSHENGS